MINEPSAVDSGSTSACASAAAVSRGFATQSDTLQLLQQAQVLLKVLHGAMAPVAPGSLSTAREPAPVQVVTNTLSCISHTHFSPGVTSAAAAASAVAPAEVPHVPSMTSCSACSR